MITHYDLFAGIGGFSLALDKVFYDQEIEHIFCEWEAFPTAILKKHWPNATYYGDIADLVADTTSQRQQGQREYQRPSDTEKNTNKETDTLTSNNSTRCHELTILTGGFPCQPFSHAGRRQGTSDDRYKWPDMFAVIQNVRPDWVIAENVRGLVTWNEGMVLETVCADLESEGYEVQPIVIPAVSIGAPHRRDRVWIIANREHQRCTQREHEERPRRKTEVSTLKTSSSWNTDWREVALATCLHGVHDGLSYDMDGVTISGAKYRKEALKAYGNAIVPQVAEEIFKAIKTVCGS